MNPSTQPLREERRALRPELATVRADTVGTATESDQVERAHRLLVRLMHAVG